MGAMEITRFGHAAVLVEAAGTRILIDPGVFSTPATFALTDLDAIIVTHQHTDHLDRDRIDALIASNPGATLLAEPETAESLAGWESTAADRVFEIGALRVTGVGSRHAEILPGLPRVGNVGLLVTGADQPTFFHPGDTYEYRPDGVDVLALPLSAPWAKVSETVDFVRSVAPRTVFPIHDCTIATVAYDIYWTHVTNHGGVDDAQRLAQDGSLAVRT